MNHRDVESHCDDVLWWTTMLTADAPSPVHDQNLSEDYLGRVLYQPLVGFTPSAVVSLSAMNSS